MVTLTKPKSIQEVAEHHLCAGCGVCSYLEPDAYQMVTSTEGFRRPLPILAVSSPGAASAAEGTLGSCPGAGLRHEERLPTGHDSSAGSTWGPVLEVWEGWATDPDVRWRGSSGGAATALALTALESEEAVGVLHTRGHPTNVLVNETVMSRTRADLLSATGSRYAPASPCEGLGDIEAAVGPCVFIGKPCDVAAAVAAARVRPGLAVRLDLTIAVFCAGTPSTAGTVEVLDRMGLGPDDVTELSYRGRGWPGEFTARTRDGKEHRLSYAESWGAVLQKHRQWRCMICPDHTGEFADIAVGDPWYREIEEGDPGRSLVVVRTERGQRAVRRAIAAGTLALQRVPTSVLVASQPHLQSTRGAVWGRVTTMRALGMKTPSYRNLPTLPVWLRLPFREKVRSILGTVRRVRERRLRVPAPVRRHGRPVPRERTGER